MKKPRVAIYYHTNFGRNDGPPLYYYNVLESELKLDVAFSKPEGDTTSINGKRDIHIVVDYGEDGLPVPEWYPPQDGGKTVYIVSDTHLGRDYRFKKAERFEYVFFNQLRALQEFKESKHIKPYHKVSWLPHAAEPTAFPRYPIIKKYDVCFIGHLQEEKNFNGINRVGFLDAVSKEFPNFYFGARNGAYPDKNVFEDAAKRMSESKVCLNLSIKDDVNMRVFETLSTGSFLLTNWLPTLQDLFTIDEHFMTFRSVEEAVGLVRGALKQEVERERIAYSGHKIFLEKHTYKHRALEVLRTCGYPIE